MKFYMVTCSRRVVVSYGRKYMHEVLVNSLVKLAQEKVWFLDMTITVDWGVKPHTHTHTQRKVP